MASSQAGAKVLLTATGLLHEELETTFAPECVERGRFSGGVLVAAG